MRDTSSTARSVGERTPHHRIDHALFDRRPGREPIGFHVTIRLEDDRPIATTPASLRVFARVVLEQGEQRGLLAFGAADGHVHAAGPNVSSRRLGDSLGIGLRAVQSLRGERREPALIRAVERKALLRRAIEPAVTAADSSSARR